MKCAKCGYVLENGLLLKSGDIIKIICNDGENGIGEIIDIGINGVMISLEDEIGEMDVLFSEVKDIEMIKESK